MKIQFSGQPEIVLANQKDQFYAFQFRNCVEDAVKNAFGARQLLRFAREWVVLSDLLYYGIPILLGKQTLGEEYSEILQIDEIRMVQPRIKRRGLLLFFYICVPYVFEIGSSIPYSTMKSRMKHQGNLKMFKDFLIVWLREDFPKFQRWVFKYIGPLHLALFYLNGTYYHISKRLTHIRYILMRDSSKKETHLTYSVLGWILFMRLMINLLKTHKISLKWDVFINALSNGFDPDTGNMKPVLPVETTSRSSFISKSNIQCGLCLEGISSPTCTLCGHIFCWICIHEWSQSKNDCPQCRRPIKPQNFCCLFNFS